MVGRLPEMFQEWNSRSLSTDQKVNLDKTHFGNQVKGVSLLGIQKPDDLSFFLCQQGLAEYLLGTPGTPDTLIDP